MTDFYAQLTQKTGFNEALVCHALNFSRKIDINEFSRLFFDTECFSVEKSGVLYFKEAFYPFEFYNKLLEISLVPEISSLYIYICLLEKSFCDFSRRIEDTSIFFETAKKLVESSKKYYWVTFDVYLFRLTLFPPKKNRSGINTGAVVIYQ